jgi:hypothetical protein
VGLIVVLEVFLTPLSWLILTLCIPILILPTAPDSSSSSGAGTVGRAVADLGNELSLTYPQETKKNQVLFTTLSFDIAQSVIFRSFWATNVNICQTRTSVDISIVSKFTLYMNMFSKKEVLISCWSWKSAFRKQVYIEWNLASNISWCARGKWEAFALFKYHICYPEPQMS